MKALLWIIGIVVIGGLVYYFFFYNSSPASTVTSTSGNAVSPAIGHAVNTQAISTANIRAVMNFK